ncbi:MAG TPA: alpha/beta hydrolase [Gemmatimonadaceae bacterium]|nr:alpha/beta hydrolase [Gemmatimonadaceae bacterium]
MMSARPVIPPPRASGFTTTTPVPLYWARYGDALRPPLLCLHGGPGAHLDYLLPQMLALAPGRDLVFYDQRGGGRSRTDDRGVITWHTQVEDLALVVRELGLEPLTLLGYSWGGLLALLYAAQAAADPALPAPARLVLIDPAPISRQYRAMFEAEFARRQSAPALHALRAELAASGLRERDPEAYRQRTFELSVAGYFADPLAAHDLTPFRVTGRVQQSIWDSLGDYDLVRGGQLARVRCPALVVHGRQDPIPLASSEECARALGARLVALDHCGHVPYVEQPAALFAAIEEFLA